jgi:lysophospholipase L1-like esterase
LWIGDSHAAADYWPGTLRSALQKRFGRGGPGYVYLGYKGYRHDGIGLEVDGKWASRPKSPATSKPFGDGAFGLGGVLLRGVEDQPRVTLTLGDVDPAARVLWDLCYKLTAPNDELSVTLGNAPRQLIKATAQAPAGGIRHLALSTRGPATLRVVPTSGQPELCGVVIETDAAAGAGVVLDTVGINGARFATVLAYNERDWAAELRRRRPDLVLLEFGTNEAGENARPAIFGRQLEQLVGRLRKAVPEADCAVVAPGDRADAEARMGPMRDALRASATASGCWFFDSYEAMGGQGAARRWRDENPPRAAKDGIHLTAKGYRDLGSMLSEALLREFVHDARPVR